MRQVRREQEERSVVDRNHDLIGILGGELRHWRPDDARLASGVVEIDDLRARVGANVINRAQEVIRMTVIPVRRTAREDGRLAARDFQGVITDAQEAQDAFGRAQDASA